MKQKYLILRSKGTELIIREFAELNKETLSLLCEETYDDETIKSAIAKGKDALIAKLRTQNMFPPALYAGKIAESVMNLYGAESNQSISIELFFDDKETLIKAQDELDVESDLENESDEFAGLVEDTNEIENVISPIKISENDSVDVKEDI